MGGHSERGRLEEKSSGGRAWARLGEGVGKGHGSEWGVVGEGVGVGKGMMIRAAAGHRPRLRRSHNATLMERRRHAPRGRRARP